MRLTRSATLVFCGALACSAQSSPPASGLESAGGAGNAGIGGGAGKAGGIGSGGSYTLVPDCGNSRLDPEYQEECDDGNTSAGDGCSPHCYLENPTCGDGLRAMLEPCDDGNTVADDGCSADCRSRDPRFLCTPGIPCTLFYQCGNSRIDPNELCDDANEKAGDGCSSECAVEYGWKCEGEPSTCRATACGDGALDPTEACDDGNREVGDGCSDICQREPDCESRASCRPICADGITSEGEACDDSNLRPGDGCSPECQLEPGFACGDAGALGSVCAATCGDRLIALGEECDDGSNQVEYGEFACGRGCQLAGYCGDGIVQVAFEGCDDGNPRDGPEGGCVGCQLAP